MKKSKFVMAAAAMALVLAAGVGVYNTFQASAVDGEYEGYPAEKMEIVKRQQHDQMIAKQTAKPDMKAPGGPLIKQEDPEVVPGILDQVDDPMSMKVINYTNGWRGKSAQPGRAIVAGAGALTEDTAQGVMMVRMPGQPGTLNFEKFLTPGKHGAVTIESYKGMDLTIVAQDGTKWSFNVASGKFTDVK
ncbi:MAG TPA: hypothetical protein VFV52_14335 [Bacilli bacterium]|nr:hypothetical protein [Bacilli bacterium]